MYLSGIADEAGEAIERQIEAIQELGWNHIELRKVKVGDHPTGMIHDISDEDFDVVVQKLEEADIRVSCFSSAIGNWQKSVLDPFDSSIEEAQRCIPRMKRLNCEFVRVMSMFLLKDDQGHPLPPEEQHADERFQRMRVIQKMFADEGLQPVHENCMNYGGMGWTYTMELLEQVPGLKLVFDTGNPVMAVDFSEPEPHPMQSAWAFYEKVRDHVVYVHIKDGIWNEVKKECTWSFPDEGQADVPRIVKDLLDRKYNGGLSIEPHMVSVIHEGEESDPQAGYNNFVEYGRRMLKILLETG